MSNNQPNISALNGSSFGSNITSNITIAFHGSSAEEESSKPAPKEQQQADNNNSAIEVRLSPSTINGLVVLPHSLLHGKSKKECMNELNASKHILFLPFLSTEYKDERNLDATKKNVEAMQGAIGTLYSQISHEGVEIVKREIVDRFKRYVHQHSSDHTDIVNKVENYSFDDVKNYIMRMEKYKNDDHFLIHRITYLIFHSLLVNSNDPNAFKNSTLVTAIQAFLKGMGLCIDLKEILPGKLGRRVVHSVLKVAVGYLSNMRKVFYQIESPTGMTIQLKKSPKQNDGDHVIKLDDNVRRHYVIPWNADPSRSAYLSADLSKIESLQDYDSTPNIDELKTALDSTRKYSRSAVDDLATELVGKAKDVGIGARDL